jgi:hypothetical protein
VSGTKLPGVPTLAKSLKGTAVKPAQPTVGAELDPSQVPPEVQQEAAGGPAAPEFAPENAAPIKPEELPEDIARQALTPSEYEERRKQLAYGVGIGNAMQAGAEAAARSATLGLSDLAMRGLGADPEGLREREARNEVAAGIGTVLGIAAPVILTGGVAGAEYGLGAALAEATPAALVSRVGAAAAEAVTSAAGEGLMARIAAAGARAATEGAIFSAGARLSGRVLNGEDVWDANAAGEYLAAAGEGAGIGLAFGVGGSLVSEGLGAAVKGAKALGGKVVETMQAPIRGAEAEMTAAQSADYSARVRAAQQRLDSLTAEQFAPETAQLKQEAAAHWAEATSKAGELPDSGVPIAKMRADAPLEQLHGELSKEATLLGIEPKATRSAWDRLVQGRSALENMDADHADTVRRIVQHGDELELRSANALDELTLSRRNEAIRRALAGDMTAAPGDQIVQAFGAQVKNVRASLSEFLDDADPTIKSYAKKLDKFVAQAEKSIGGLDPKAGSSAADAYETLDQMNRVLGRVRAKLGDRSPLGIDTLSERLSGLYEDSRQLLKNPNIVGEKAADIGARAKAAWTDVFDSSGGYRRALLASDSGGARLASGFETADRYDPAKVAKWLRTINDPESQLQLELVARGIDAHAKLLRTFAEDLAPGADALENIEAYQATSKKLVDEILSYRSRASLAQEYADSVAPAVKAAEAAEGKIAAAQAKAEARLAVEQQRAQEVVQREVGKAEEMKAAAVAKAQAKLQETQDRVSTGIARSALQGVGVMLGGHLGGGLGALAGEALAGSFTQLTTPIVRAMSKAGLESAIRTDATMKVASKAAGAAAKIQAATQAIGQALHGGTLERVAEKAVIENVELKDRYDHVKKAVENAPAPSALGDYTPRTSDALAQTQMRAQEFLKQAMPPEHRPAGMRTDIDKLAAPQRMEMRRWLRQVQAVQNPAAVIRAAAAGDVDPAQAAAVRHVYPELMKRVAIDVAAHSQKLQKQPPMRVAVAVGTLLGEPVHFTQQPAFVQFTQHAFAQQSQQNQPQARRPSGGSKLPGAQTSGLERAEAL